MPTLGSPLLSIPSCALLASIALALAPSAAAQCTYSWPASAFGTGCNDGVTAATVLPNGDAVVGGRFSDAGGVAVSRIARWDGAAWNTLGTGMNQDVHVLLALPDGQLLAGGAFTTAGGITCNGVARWDGSTWNAVGSGVDPIVVFGSSVQALAILGNGELVAGGSFTSIGGLTVNNIARWNGTTWSALGTGINGPVRGLTVAANGDMFATGSFTLASGVAAANIARWNGTAWSAVGTGLSVFGGSAITTMPNGDIVVGGSFLTAGGAAANRIARWNGTAWSALGSGVNALVTSLLAMPNGDVVAGGLFTTAGGAPANRIARWNGSVWNAFGSGTDNSVQELALLNTGDVLAAGEFLNANATPAGRVARLVSSCAPSAVSLGGGCTGIGGPNVLTATQLPLLGGTFRAVGTGMPPLGLVVSLLGFSSGSVPLNAIFAEALPGCLLTCAPDSIGTLTPSAGVATTVISVPNTPALAGAVAFHQYLPFALDLSLVITEITATNGLQVTLGTF